MPESSRKMVWAEPRKPCERDEGNFFGEMLFDKLHDQSLLSRGQATSKRRGRNSGRFFGSDVFMHGDAGSTSRDNIGSSDRTPSDQNIATAKRTGISTGNG